MPTTPARLIPSQAVGRALTRRIATGRSILFFKYYTIMISNWVNWLAIYATQIHQDVSSIGA
jgi:hypothetical protein